MITIRQLQIAILLIGLFCLHSNLAVAEEGTQDVPRVLIVTGEDYKGHLWQQTTPLLRNLIQQPL